MGPYRARVELPRPKHAFGDERARRLKILGALALLAFSAFLIAASIAVGGDLSGFVVYPAIGGVLLLAHARVGSIALRPEERVGDVVVRRFVRTQRVRFAYADVLGTTIAPVSFRAERADYELRLELKGDRSIALLRAGSMAELEAPRVSVDAFLADNGLPLATEYRVAGAAPAGESLDASADGEEAARRGQSS